MDELILEPMKKHLLLAIVFFLFLISGYSQTACQVTATASSTTVCVGQQVTVSATAMASIPSNQFFDFNQNQLPQGWSTTVEQITAPILVVQVLPERLIFGLLRQEVVFRRL
jgi:hypothetical protein